MERPTTFLEEIDARQSNVLERLDELNDRVEQIIEGWLSGRMDTRPPDPPDPPRTEL